MANYRGNEEKTILARRAIMLVLLSLAILLAAAYIVLRFQSLAWFVDREDTTAGTMQVVAKATGYDLLVERTAEYDSLVNGDPKYENMGLIKSKLASSGYDYDFIETSTEVADQLAYELRSETYVREDGANYYSIMPGSCGTLTFYLKPQSGDVQAHLTLLTECFVNRYENNVLTIQAVDSPTVRDLLRGHILFFTERQGNAPSNYRYNGLLDTGEFVYDTSEHALCTKPGKTDCYEITLYWEWVLTYYDMADNTGSTAWEEKFPPELQDFIEEAPACFFATNLNSTDPNELSDGYNDGDQTIGENANFFVAYIAPR